MGPGVLALQAMVVCKIGPGTGLGHLSRCLVLARALEFHLGAKVELLIQGDAIQRPDLAAFPHCFAATENELLTALDHFALGEAVNAPIASVSKRLLVFDWPGAQLPNSLSRQLARWRSANILLAGIDGMYSVRQLLDLIFIPSFYCVPPAGMAPHGARIVHGWDCYLLDEALQTLPWQAGSKVLALTGGSDATGLGRHWPAELDARLPASCELHWVTGPYAAQPSWPSPTRLTWHEHRAPAGLGPLMRDCQYAVTVYGVSFFELLRLGIPTVVFSPYGDKDTPELRALAQSELALVAQNEHQATEYLITLMQDEALCRSLRARTKTVFGQAGGEQFAQIIQNFIRP